MNHTASVLILFPIIVSVLVFGIWSNTYAYTQQASSPGLSGPASQQHVSGIKITSPTRGQQVPVGKDLTISGTSIDNVTSNDCKVSVIINKVRPYQNTTAIGPGGAADYSKWNFVLTSKYTTIKPGQNKITAKYECANDPHTISFSSVNITGVQGTGAPSSSTKPTTTAAAPSLKKQQQVSTTNAVSPSTGYITWAKVGSLRKISETSSSSSTSPLSIAPQIKAINQQQAAPSQQLQLRSVQPITPINATTDTNYTAGQNYTFAAATAPSPMDTSDQMFYLGYHGNSDSKYNDNRDSNTRSVSDSTLKPKDTKPHFTPSDIGIKKTSSVTKSSSVHDTKQSTGVSDSAETKKTSMAKIDTYDSNEDKSSRSTEGSANIENNSGGHSIFGFSDG
jgi:hypothetical protein